MTNPGTWVLMDLDDYQRYSPPCALNDFYLASAMKWLIGYLYKKEAGESQQEACLRLDSPYL